MLRIDDLVAAARATTERQRRQVSEARLRDEAELRAGEAGGAGRFREALRGEGVSIIAEVKGASPLSGRLRDDYEPLRLARAYVEGGARAVSVLTEERYFGGDIEHLETISAEVPLPTLRKDFVVDFYQVYRAATAGAAAVLLIAEVLEPGRLAELVEAARSVGLDALVELHEPGLLDGVYDASSGLVGVNNRDLDSMEVDFEHALRLAADLPPGWVRVAESGIGEPGQMQRLREAGYDAALVGTALVRADDPGKLLEALRRGGGDGAVGGDGGRGEDTRRGEDKERGGDGGRRGDRERPRGEGRGEEGAEARAGGDRR